MANSKPLIRPERRQAIVQELIETEQNYVEDLKVAIEVPSYSDETPISVLVL
jgi:hypothetical protein